MPRIGIDLMGSDTPAPLLLDALVGLAPELGESVQLTLLGTLEVLQDASLPRNITPVIAEEVIEMSDDPIAAVRKKKHSSMTVGIRLLSEKKLDALISAGSTGALLASATMTLSTLPGIARPALLALMPTRQKPLAVIDVGANASVKVDHLVQFALMALAYQKSRGIAHPTIGLLNIGTEETKGTPELREAYRRLQTLNTADSPPVFIGNIEGKEVFNGDVDALVTDGFTGNVFLKTAEGISAFLIDELDSIAQTDAPESLKHSLRSWHTRLTKVEYPDAILCGVDGIVVKCHGDVSPEGLASSVRNTLRLIQHHFQDKIKAELTAALS